MPRVSSGEASIYYELFRRPGGAPAIVFAHGAGGNTMSWYQQVPHFAQSHTVVTFDHRSFGRSSCPPAAFHPKHFPADLIAILDAERIESAALVCQSMGGWTGLRTALEHPRRVSCLVLCGTPGGLFTEKVAESLTQIGRRVGREGVSGNAALAPDFPSRDPARAFLYDQIGALNTGVDQNSLGTMFDADARVDPAALSTYEIPTLLLSGAHDLLFPPEVLADVVSRIPGCELTSFADAGHSTYFECPEEFNRVVDEFVSKHATGH